MKRWPNSSVNAVWITIRPTVITPLVTSLQVKISFLPPGTKSIDHPKASEAKYQIARLQRQSGTSSNPIASLERVTKQDANYLLARFEICSVRFDLWKKEKDPEPRSSINCLRCPKSKGMPEIGPKTCSRNQLRLAGCWGQIDQGLCQMLS